MSQTDVTHQEIIKESEYFNVMARVRPFLHKERGKCRCVYPKTQNEFEILYRDDTINVKLDRIFSEESTQHEIFQYFQSTIELFLKGVNITILAYGHTGSGIFHKKQKL